MKIKVHVVVGNKNKKKLINIDIDFDELPLEVVDNEAVPTEGAERIPVTEQKEEPLIDYCNTSNTHYPYRVSAGTYSYYPPGFAALLGAYTINMFLMNDKKYGRVPRYDELARLIRNAAWMYGRSVEPLLKIGSDISGRDICQMGIEPKSESILWHVDTSRPNG
jgi:hypothetical protein